MGSYSRRTIGRLIAIPGRTPIWSLLLVAKVVSREAVTGDGHHLAQRGGVGPAAVASIGAGVGAYTGGHVWGVVRTGQRGLGGGAQSPTVVAGAAHLRPMPEPRLQDSLENHRQADRQRERGDQDGDFER